MRRIGRASLKGISIPADCASEFNDLTPIPHQLRRLTWKLTGSMEITTADQRSRRSSRWAARRAWRRMEARLMGEDQRKVLIDIRPYIFGPPPSGRLTAKSAAKSAANSASTDSCR